MPNSVSANKNASCKFSRLGLLHTRSMSTRLGRRALITAKKAKPVRQLGPKSFTSSPRHLQTAQICEVKRTKRTFFVQEAFISFIYVINKALYLVAVCWTHLSKAFLAPPCRARGLRLTGGLVVSVLLVELSREELLLEKAWSSGRLLVSSSICRERKTTNFRLLMYSAVSFLA